ncbi:MAG: hypothetical protein AB8B55_22355 [Mariniblastus sp.]
MKRQTTIALTLVLATVATGALGAIGAIVVQERKTKKVTRVKRPQFTERDWDGIYFEDLYRDGLVGDRPAKAVAGSANPQIAKTNGMESGNAAPASGEFTWSKLIARSVIEDEIKALQNKLIRDVTTPIKFKSEYNKAHQSFSMLSMLFGIIRQYDGEVRWKKYSGAAQASFERAAANARVGTIQAYESCKRRKEDLQEMVRGGSFAGTDKPPETLDWPVVVGRSPLMVRLVDSKDTLKQLTSSESVFSDDIETAAHEAQLVAAIAEVLMKDNMDDADEDDYLDYAKSMRSAAVSIVEACKTKDYEAASKAYNVIDQSCSNCHDDWRD